jgi:hypothetical protein
MEWARSEIEEVSAPQHYHFRELLAPPLPQLHLISPFAFGVPSQEKSVATQHYTFWDPHCLQQFQFSFIIRFSELAG